MPMAVGIERCAAIVHARKRLSFFQTSQKLVFFILGIVGLTAVLFSHEPLTGHAEEKAEPSTNANAGLTLGRAVLCEAVENLNPVNPAWVFSVSQGQIYCFTEFATVRAQTVVFHRWYHRDSLTTQIRLKLYPPRWSTHSVLRLREADKGPWKVEITDAEGRVLNVLRFSIVD